MVASYQIVRRTRTDVDESSYQTFSIFPLSLAARADALRVIVILNNHQEHNHALITYELHLNWFEGGLSQVARIFGIDSYQVLCGLVAEADLLKERKLSQNFAPLHTLLDDDIFLTRFTANTLLDNEEPEEDQFPEVLADDISLILGELPNRLRKYEEIMTAAGWIEDTDLPF